MILHNNAARKNKHETHSEMSESLIQWLTDSTTHWIAQSERAKRLKFVCDLDA